MYRLFRLFRCLNGLRTPNGMSASIAMFAMVFLYLESAPTPAGADVARRITNKSTFVIATATPEAAAKPQQADLGQTAETAEQRHERDMITKIQLIEKGVQFLSTVNNYTAQFVKQELVNGELLDEQEMDLKIRHAPFSIYLKWNTGEVGREVLYVDGAHDGRLAAHAGGWKARLPFVFLEPSSSLAMAESRYPITKAGLFELAKLMLRVHKEDLEQKKFSRCEKLADQAFDNRPCHVFVVEYKDKSYSEQYRKSICLIDKEWSIPVYTRNFGWLDGDVPADPEEFDKASLLEFYSYSSVNFGSNLLAADFDHANEEYRFKRQ